MDDFDPDFWGRTSQFEEGKIRFKINTLLQSNKGVRRLRHSRTGSTFELFANAKYQ